MHDFLVEGRQFALIEARRRAAEMREVETVDQRLHVGKGLDRLRGTEPRQQRRDRDGLQAHLAKMGDAQRAKALRQFTFAASQQRFMREMR